MRIQLYSKYSEWVFYVFKVNFTYFHYFQPKLFHNELESEFIANFNILKFCVKNTIKTWNHAVIKIPVGRLRVEMYTKRANQY